MIVIDQYGGVAEWGLIAGIARPAQIFVTRLPDGRITTFAQVDTSQPVANVPPDLQQRLMVESES